MRPSAVITAPALPNAPRSQVPSTGLGSITVYDARLLAGHPAAGGPVDGTGAGRL